MLELDLFGLELSVGCEAEQLEHGHGDELDFMHRDGQLILDLVDLNRMVFGVVDEGDDAAVREELLKPEAGLEPAADGFGAGQEQHDQVVSSRLPGSGAGQPEMPIVRLGHGRAPQPPQRIARGPTRSIGKHRQICARARGESLDVETEGFEGVHDAAGPRARHPESRVR